MSEPSIEWGEIRPANRMFVGDPADWCPTCPASNRRQYSGNGKSALKPCPICGYDDPEPEDAA